MCIPGNSPHLRKLKPHVTAHWRRVLLCWADSSLWTSLFAHGFRCVDMGLDACDPAGRALAPGISQHPVSQVWIAIIFVDIPTFHWVSMMSCQTDRGAIFSWRFRGSSTAVQAMPPSMIHMRVPASQAVDCPDHLYVCAYGAGCVAVVTSSRQGTTTTCQASWF